MAISSRLKKIITTIFGGLVLVWIICPLPEISIIVGLLGGKTMENFLPRWFSWTLSFCGAVVGTAIVHDFNIVGKLKKNLRSE